MDRPVPFLNSLIVTAKTLSWLTPTLQREVSVQAPAKRSENTIEKSWLPQPLRWISLRDEQHFDHGSSAQGPSSLQTEGNAAVPQQIWNRSRLIGL
jgi:hypothetical protein